jgi:hypothetical protein
MERDVAVELWTNALDSGTQFSTYVGDDDSTIIGQTQYIPNVLSPLVFTI